MEGFVRDSRELCMQCCPLVVLIQFHLQTLRAGFLKVGSLKGGAQLFQLHSVIMGSVVGKLRN